MSGSLRFAGSAAAPEIELAGVLADWRFGGSEPSNVVGRASYRDSLVQGEFELYREEQKIFDGHFRLPLDLAVAPQGERRLPGALEVTAVAERVELASLIRLTPLRRLVQRPSGTLDADIGIRGSWERPELTGRVAVTDGAAAFPALGGVRHRGLQAELVLRGDTVKIERLEVRSGSGSATASGYVRLEELTQPILDLRIQGRDFRVIDVRDFLTLAATADLDLRGPVFGAVLSGRGTATEGVLYFADLVEKDVVNLEDELFRPFVDTMLIRRQGLGAAFENRFLDSLRIDGLRLDMGSAVWLRSSEANMRLLGSLTVNKARRQYRLDGGLEVPFGSYRLAVGPLSKDFVVTRGQVRYLGTPDLDADLDIDAEHVVRTTRGEDVTIAVHIGGTVYEPALTLSSDVQPPLPESELIAYLMFGGPSVEAFAGASGERNRLAAEQVAGAISGQLEYSLISDLRLPLDYFRIRPMVGGPTGRITGTEIALGKQFMVLGTTAFLTASPRICRSETSFYNIGASLEFRLTRDWLIAASADPAQACAVPGTGDTSWRLGFDLFWDKRY